MSKKIRFLFPTCNYNCIFCHKEGTIFHNIQCKSPEFFDEIIIKALNNGYNPEFVFSGGEPLLYTKEIIGFLKHFKSFARKYTIITNGSQIDSDLLSKLADYNVSLHINLPTLDDKLYKYITGTSVFVTDIIRNIKNATKQLDVHINYVVCNGINSTFHELKRMLRFCEKTGIQSLRLIEYLNISSEINNYYFNLEDYILSLSLNVISRQSRKIKLLNGNNYNVDFIKCSCANECNKCKIDRDLYLSSDGWLLPCAQSQKKISIEDSQAIYNYINWEG